MNPSTSERNRFFVYAEDFAGHDTQLFLTEMNRGKKYEDDSKLLFFKKTFNWIMNHIVVINPNIGISNTDAYYSEESLDTISNLIRTFDTGVSEIKTKQITVDEMTQMVPKEVLSEIFSTLKKQMQITNLPQLKMTFVERDGSNASKIYLLDRFKERYDKKLSKAYLEGRYGAIPAFKYFTFRKEE